MQMRNSAQSFGWVSLFLHWAMALVLIGLYFVGDYMVDLTYYSRWYHTLPAWHKAIGILTGFVLLFRVVWVYTQTRPAPTGHGTAFSHRLATLGHSALYILLFVMLISGYLISTAKGKGIDVFGWFELPALLAENKDRGERAGDIHEIAGTLFMLLVGVHTFAALFHHFYWKDNTLTRMLGIAPKS